MHVQELVPRGPDAVVLLDEWVKRAIAVRGGADWGALAQFVVSITLGPPSCAPSADKSWYMLRYVLH